MAKVIVAFRNFANTHKNCYRFSGVEIWLCASRGGKCLNDLSHLRMADDKIKPLKMDLIEGSETSANINQTLGIHPKIETVKIMEVSNNLAN
jgi:hypothetical protein